MPEQEPLKRESKDARPKEVERPKVPLEFHIPVPGEANPDLPPNGRVHLGLDLPEIKSEE